MFSRQSGFGAAGDKKEVVAGRVLGPATTSPRTRRAAAVVHRFLSMVVARRCALAVLTSDTEPVGQRSASERISMVHSIVFWAWPVFECRGNGQSSSKGHPALAIVGQLLKSVMPISVETKHLSLGDMARLYKVCVALIDLAAVSIRGVSVVPPAVLLASLQTLLALIELPAHDFVRIVSTARNCGCLRRSGRGQQQLWKLSSFRLLCERIANAETAMVARKLVKPSSTEAAQDQLILDALYRVLWSTLDAAYNLAKSAHHREIDIISRDLVLSATQTIWSVRGLRCASLCDAWPGAKALETRLAFVQWIAESFAVEMFDSDNSAVTAAVMSNLMSLHFHLLARLMKTTASVDDSAIDTWSSWWWSGLFLSGAHSTKKRDVGSMLAASPPLVPERTLRFVRLVARDNQLLGQLSVLWTDRLLCRRLLTPQGTMLNSSSNGEHRYPTRDAKESGGFFAELKRLASSEKSAVPVPWSQSLLRRDQQDACTPEGIQRTVAAFVATAFTLPPLWMRSVTLLSLLCQESITPLHELSFLGPVVVHTLHSKVVSDPSLTTLVDVMFAAELPSSSAVLRSAPSAVGPEVGEAPVAVLHETVRMMMLVAMASLSCLTQLCAHLLLVTGDKEFTELGCPLPMDRVHSLVEVCNVVLFSIAQRLTTCSAPPKSLRDLATANGLLRNATTDRWIREDPCRVRFHMVAVVRALQDRSLRMPRLTHAVTYGDSSIKQLTDPNAYDERFWFLDKSQQDALFPGCFETALDSRPTAPESRKWTSLQTAVLQLMPHVVPFADRIEYFCWMLNEDKKRFGVAGNAKLGLTIRRGHLLEDVMEQLRMAQLRHPDLAADGRCMRVKWHIQFIDAQGQPEAGIDAGGVFKEFMDFVVKESFHPNLGLFVPIRAAEDEGGKAERVLHPNPAARRLFGASGDGAAVNYLEYFRFLGLLIAKAIYEGIVLNLELAPTCINNILGRGNSIDDLQLVDPQQFRSLQMLKDLDCVSDAELYFSVDEDAFGTVEVVDLVPNGRNVRVTNENVISYLHLMANYILVKRNKDETAAFAAGIFEILPRSTITFLFHQREMQQLISGRNGLRLDVADLKAHCRLVGGIEADSRTLTLLWEVLEKLSADDQGRFLQFCTGSSKPPLLGFASLNPPFSIRGVEDGSFLNFVVDIDRLPSASTCFNLLKLPLYRNKKNLKEKLLQAIRSESGFQLS